MNKRLVGDFLLTTFCLTAFFWGGAALLSTFWGLDMGSPILQVMHILGGFSPTAASYISLVRCKKTDGFIPWLSSVFDVKHRPSVYLVALLFTAIYFVTGCAVNGFEMGAPFSMLLIILPMTLFMGGNEEAGWRMILQPELEKELGFFGAAAVTAGIWWIWHLPLFFIKGTSNFDMNFFLFGIMCLSLSFALAAIRKISGGVFPCVLTHCLINGLSSVFVFSFSAAGCLLTLAVTVVTAVMIIRKV